MRESICRVLLPLLAILGIVVMLGGEASAHADIEYWGAHAGNHPLVERGTPASAGFSTYAIDCAVKGLQMDTETAADFRIAASGQGMPGEKTLANGDHIKVETVIIPDRMRLSSMVFEGCHVIANVEARWPAGAPSERHGTLVTITHKNGKIDQFIMPHICKNWSRVARVPPPPAPKCFELHFNYQSNINVTAATAGELVAMGKWPGSADEGYNSETLLFAFITFHTAFASQREYDDFAKDECTALIDEAGVHHRPDYECKKMCDGKGHWPHQDTIDAVAAAYGVRLPTDEPNGRFLFPCANGRCVFRIPMWYAKLLAERGEPLTACVDTLTYPVSITGRDPRDRGWDSDNIDVVEAVEITAALAHAPKSGNARLGRELHGIASYADPE